MIASNLSWSCAWCANVSDSAGAHRKTADNRSQSEVGLSPTGHLIVAVCLGFIGTFGFLNNALVLVLFCRYKLLRSPINCLLASISVSDLLVCVLGTPFSFAASARRRWLIGAAGCVWCGFINSFLGIVSMISLAVLSYERYCTMIITTQADATSYRKVIMGITFSWIYSMVWTLPPLFGWSRYSPEGPGTTCSVNWTTRTANNLSYIVCLFFFCLFLPFFVIVYSYGKLLQAIKQFYRCFRALLMCTAIHRGSTYKNSSKCTKTPRTLRCANGPNATIMGATPYPAAAINPDSNKLKSGSDPEGHSSGDGMAPGTVKPIISLVAYYNG